MVTKRIKIEPGVQKQKTAKAEKVIEKATNAFLEYQKEAEKDILSGRKNNRVN